MVKKSSVSVRIKRSRNSRGNIESIACLLTESKGLSSSRCGTSGGYLYFFAPPEYYKNLRLSGFQSCYYIVKIAWAF